MRLVLDLDGVVFDFVSGFRDHLRKKGFEVPDGLPKFYNFQDWKINLYNEHFDFIESGGYAKLSLLEVSTLSTIRQLAAGNDILFATARAGHNPLKITKDTQLSLNYHSLNFPVVYTKDKHLLDGDIFVDDSPYICENIKTRGKTVFCYNALYNQEYGGQRIFSLEDLLEKF